MLSAFLTDARELARSAWQTAWGWPAIAASALSVPGPVRTRSIGIGAAAATFCIVGAPSWDQGRPCVDFRGVVCAGEPPLPERAVLAAALRGAAADLRAVDAPEAVTASHRMALDLERAANRLTRRRATVAEGLAVLDAAAGTRSPRAASMAEGTLALGLVAAGAWGLLRHPLSAAPVAVALLLAVSWVTLLPNARALPTDLGDLVGLVAWLGATVYTPLAVRAAWLGAPRPADENVAVGRIVFSERVVGPRATLVVSAPAEAMYVPAEVLARLWAHPGAAAALWWRSWAPGLWLWSVWTRWSRGPLDASVGPFRSSVSTPGPRWVADRLGRVVDAVGGPILVDVTGMRRLDAERGLAVLAVCRWLVAVDGIGVRVDLSSAEVAALAANDCDPRDGSRPGGRDQNNATTPS